MELKLPGVTFKLGLEYASGDPRKGSPISEVEAIPTMPGLYRYRLPEGLHGKQYRIRLENTFDAFMFVLVFVDGVPVGATDPYSGHESFRLLPGEERTIVGHGYHGVVWCPFFFGDQGKKGLNVPKIGTLRFQVTVFERTEFTVEFVY